MRSGERQCLCRGRRAANRSGSRRRKEGKLRRSCACSRSMQERKWQRAATMVSVMTKPRKNSPRTRTAAEQGFWCSATTSTFFWGTTLSGKGCAGTSPWFWARQSGEARSSSRNSASETGQKVIRTPKWRSLSSSRRGCSRSCRRNFTRIWKPTGWTPKAASGSQARTPCRGPWTSSSGGRRRRSRRGLPRQTTAVLILRRVDVVQKIEESKNKIFELERRERGNKDNHLSLTPARAGAQKPAPPRNARTWCGWRDT
mmetsp:Transcript_28693/g.72656  ORF Transcript_28693/g.72656 Transcript_28693/m.72656 type:complete len:257 (+) Transcript_28693:1771-2541(+)